MSLVFAAIVPHPPILVPEIGKENLTKIEKTKTAMEQLEKDLYAAKPDVLIVISPHGEIDPGAFTINICDNYEINFEAFGNFSTRLNLKGDTVMMTMGKEKPRLILSQKPNLIMALAFLSTTWPGICPISS